MLTVVVNFPLDKSIKWEFFLLNKIKGINSNNVEINCLNWKLKCKDLLAIKTMCQEYGLKIFKLRSSLEETVVSAKSIGMNSCLYLNNQNDVKSHLNKSSNECPNLIFHKGTIRSGEHINSEGDLLILGDVNPGGMVSAAGDVMIWGRLLGVAHAGKTGNVKSTISALHLRPVQLRIADKVAKGPQEKQENGLAEQAEIFSELIVINPLSIQK